MAGAIFFTEGIEFWWFNIVLTFFQPSTLEVIFELRERTLSVLFALWPLLLNCIPHCIRLRGTKLNYHILLHTTSRSKTQISEKWCYEYEKSSAEDDRRCNYSRHRGTVWPWLIHGANFSRGLLRFNVQNSKMASKWIENQMVSDFKYK